MPDLAAQIITGAFALGGGALGAGLTWLGARANDKRRLAAEDDRRWLADRREVYAGYLGLAQSLLEEIDGVGVFLSYDGTQPVSDEDEEILREGLFKYHVRWDDELQPALGEVQLLAALEVSDLADRVAAALMEVSDPVESRGTFSDFHPTWFAVSDLIAEMLRAMRRELGLPPGPDIARPRDAAWPWHAEQGEIPLRHRRDRRRLGPPDPSPRP